MNTVNQGINSTTHYDYTQLPDYEESTGARKNWWDTLQSWATQPGYGAIQPNWNDIWQNAQQKVQQYFMGGPEGPGAIATVKANLARRGQSENPAAEASIARLGMSQGNLLQDLAVQQATKEADISEKGRENWLTSLMQLAGLKPQYQVSDVTQSQNALQTASGSSSPSWYEDPSSYLSLLTLLM